MGPVFQEAREVFRSAAIGAVTSSEGSRDDAGDDRCSAAQGFWALPQGNRETPFQMMEWPVQSVHVLI